VADTKVVRDINLGYESFLEDVEHLSNSYVIVGFPDGTQTHDQSKNVGSTVHHKKGGESMAQIAAQNEFGTDKIPKRSFMRTAVDENKQKITDILNKEYTRILEKESTVQFSLDLIGNIVRDMIKVKIRSIYQPPNAPSTIQAKGSSKPLIDFGQMINAVQYKVVLK
jgi:HK97 gp10 family phage protein